MKISKVVPLPIADSGIQHGIVRFNNAFIGKQKIPRRTPVVIRNRKTNEWTIRYALGNSGNIQGLTKNVIALDYDAMNELGISSRQPCELEIKPASLIQSMHWLMTSPDLNVRLNTRFAVLGAMLGFVSLVITFLTFL